MRGTPPRLPRVTPDGRKRLRVVFFVFLLTFVASRLIVFLIMSRRIPDLFLVLGGTHVHHLNYGIFLLVAVCAYLLFLPPTVRGLRLATVFSASGWGSPSTNSECGCTSAVATGNARASTPSWCSARRWVFSPTHPRWTS